MSEEDESTGEVKETEKVIGVVFVTRDQAAEIVQPGKESFDLPTFAIAAQATAIVARRLGASVAVRDQQDDALSEEFLPQGIAVVSLVANQAQRLFFDQRLLECRFDQSYFGGRSSGGSNGERKTMSISNCHDFDALSPLGFANRSAPFLAAVKLPSIKHSERSRPPRS
jgi:hypothetical protein